MSQSKGRNSAGSDDSKRLSPELEAQLLSVFRKGTDEGRTKLLSAYMGLVGSVARRYQRFFPWTDYNELMEEGTFGLLQAAEHFDAKKSTRFSTYAWFWIVKGVQEHIAELISVMKVPASITSRFSKITHFIETEMKASREPSLEKIAKHLDMKLDDINEALGSKSNMGGMLSLNEFVDGDEQRDRLSDILANKEPMSQDLLEQLEGNQRLDEFITKLPPDEASVVRLRFGLVDEQYHTLRETAEKLNMSPQRVRDLENYGLARLKDIIGKKENQD
jgi:RNA polymerase sigma factor (sigma-70 family)